MSSSCAAWLCSPCSSMWALPSRCRTAALCRPPDRNLHICKGAIQHRERGERVLQVGAYAGGLPVAGCNEVPQQCMLGFVTDLVQA